MSSPQILKGIELIFMATHRTLNTSAFSLSTLQNIGLIIKVKKPWNTESSWPSLVGMEIKT